MNYPSMLKLYTLHISRQYIYSIYFIRSDVLAHDN